MSEPLVAVVVPTGPAGHIRPLSVGDILDLALRLYRRRLGALFALMLLFQVPLYAVQKAYEGLNRAALPARPEDWVLMEPAALQRALLVALLGIPAVLLVLHILNAWASGALFHAGREVYLGRTPGIGESLQALGRRLLPLTGTSLLLTLLLVIVAAGTAVPFGILAWPLLVSVPVIGVLVLFLALAAMTAVVIALYLRWFLTPQVVMLEGLSGLTALRRSAALMRGRIAPGLLGRPQVRGGLVLFLLFVLLLVPSSLLAVPQLALASAYGTTPGVLDLTQIPVLVRLPFELAQLGLSALLTPFATFALLLFYLDVRIRREGLDLELRAASLAPRAGGGTVEDGVAGDHEARTGADADDTEQPPPGAEAAG